MRKKLTDAGLRALKPKPHRYEVWDAVNPGLGVRVTPKGTKSFIYVYHFDNHPRRLTLGRFPGTALADARIEYSRAKAELEKGTDPGKKRVDSRKSERAAPRISHLAEEYIEKWARPRKKSWREDQRLLNHDVLPVLGMKKAKDVTRRDIRLMLDRIVERGAPITANRAFAVTRKMFKFAISRDIVSSSPCEHVEAPARETSRDRVLSESEIRQFWTGLGSADLAMSDSIKTVLRLMLVTAQRKAEVVNARWAEFDLEGGWWTIPAERSQNGLPHRVPLASLAISILGKLREQSTESEFLFPSPQRNKPIRDDAVSKAVRRNLAALGLEDFTPHDLRRTAASHMASEGTNRLVIQKILNHVESGVTAVYDRHSYDPEKRQALVAWGRWLDALVSGKTVDNVINIS